MSFQGSCSNQDPNQVHTLSLLAGFLHVSVAQGLGGSHWLLPVLPLLPPILLGAQLYSLPQGPEQSHTTRTLSTSPCPAWPVPRGPWDSEVTEYDSSSLNSQTGIQPAEGGLLSVYFAGEPRSSRTPGNNRPKGSNRKWAEGRVQGGLQAPRGGGAWGSPREMPSFCASVFFTCK